MNFMNVYKKEDVVGFQICGTSQDLERTRLDYYLTFMSFSEWQAWTKYCCLIYKKTKKHVLSESEDAQEGGWIVLQNKIYKIKL